METSTPDEQLLGHVVLPVASESDAIQTIEAVAPYLGETDEPVIVAHVIEKAGGAPDRASVEQMELRAEEIFDAAEQVCREKGLEMARELTFHTEIVQGVLDIAEQNEATAIVFTPREGSRWVRWLTGSTALKLVNGSPIPVVSVPYPDDIEGTD